MLGIAEAECDILNGHLCPLPMQGTGVIVDTMPKWGGERPEGAPSIDTPAFMLLVKHVGRCEFKEETKM
ncbi:Glyoxalase/bleomycin resistance protein/dioxygenase [Paenibacillus vortex V453]|uniref:Glyoxalase/bleomycin resistance protein/dioxygenase n=1 Tax=Paenibacillus vortex V453 TaxID=715225 RepID=A0A2R9SUZ0_9BACL|nr:Glyoxalase/bleomycin resistance protein/dioxygenase [Paenibacillus vortex V453]